jgi:hypothetical protein
MSLLKNNVGKAELLAMMLFTTGCIVDHVTTYYGLSLPTIEEANPVVLFMIGSGIWNAVEILVIVMGNSSGVLLSGSKSRGIITMSIATLVAVGLVRLYAGVHNIALITSVGRLLDMTSMVPL